MTTDTIPSSIPDNASSEVTRVDFEPQARYQPIVGPTSDHTFDEAVNLPYRTLTKDANLGEYTQETVDGQILREIKSNVTGRIERYELVTWKIDDPESPKNWSKKFKWWCTMMVAFTCFVVAMNSAVITANIEGRLELPLWDYVILLMSNRRRRNFPCQRGGCTA